MIEGTNTNTKLTLVGRQPDAFGWPQWHDSIILSNALEAITKGKSLGELSRWLKIAARLQRQMDAAEIGKAEKVDEPKRQVPNLKPVVILELHGTEPDHLWDELKKLKPDQFNHGQDLPGGPLACMIEEIAESLGKALPD